jgi:hypothetical protein
VKQDGRVRVVLDACFDCGVVDLVEDAVRDAVLEDASDYVDGEVDFGSDLVVGDTLVTFRDGMPEVEVVEDVERGCLNETLYRDC